MGVLLVSSLNTKPQVLRKGKNVMLGCSRTDVSNKSVLYAVVKSFMHIVELCTYNWDSRMYNQVCKYTFSDCCYV
jgi:hypothetical protein